MPGWWFTVESTTAKHMIQQFKSAIRAALASKQEVRAMMRARSLLQRFPVAQWIEDLEKLQGTSIQISKQQQENPGARTAVFRSISANASGFFSGTTSATSSAPQTRSTSPEPQTPAGGEVYGPGHASRTGRNRLTKSRPDSRSSSVSSFRDVSGRQTPIRPSTPGEHGLTITGDRGVSGSGTHTPSYGSGTLPLHAFPQPPRSNSPNSPDPSVPGTPTAEDGLLPIPPELGRRLSVSSMTNASQTEFNLQKVDPFFTDSNDQYYNQFEKMLGSVDAKSSEGEFCIEEYLMKSEKEWFQRFHRAKMGLPSRPGTPTSSVFRLPWGKGEGSSAQSTPRVSMDDEEFNLGQQYIAPSGVKAFLQRKIGDWQVYCYLLALVSFLTSHLSLLVCANAPLGSNRRRKFIPVDRSGWGHLDEC